MEIGAACPAAIIVIHLLHLLSTLGGSCSYSVQHVLFGSLVINHSVLLCHDIEIYQGRLIVLTLLVATFLSKLLERTWREFSTADFGENRGEGK